jgi:hypothetical protein
MRLSRKWGVLAVVLAFGIGCGDDGGPGDDLTQQERQQIANAVAGTVPFGGIAVEHIESFGKLNPGGAAALRRAAARGLSMASSAVAATEYDAFGMILDITETVQGEQQHFWIIAVVGWSGLTDTGFEELVLVIGGGDGDVPAAASGTFEDFDVLGVYLAGTTAYAAVTGDAAMNSSSFGGSVGDCSTAFQGFTVDCEVQVGEMAGDFAFEAENEAGGTYTQSPVEFAALPTVRLTMTATEGAGLTARLGRMLGRK